MDRFTAMIKEKSIAALKERSLERPMLKLAILYIEAARTAEEALDVLLSVIDSQDRSLEEIMNSLIDAESRAMPKNIFVPNEHTIIEE
jgi:hypothetical protein